ncbi:MAG TPA: pyruvate formate lyase 1-activating protein [Chromatiaceae bacterium]|nr:pyruvate formate lyase 1-activating protein [Chromatiaceae bacterium]
MSASTQPAATAFPAGFGNPGPATGRIHSFESCGAVDGPGIRFIVFTQGCLLRCQYCHNRDTWDIHAGREVSVDEIMKEALCYRHFMNASGGGITLSGGEPMLQPEFVRDLFSAARAEGIHTCLDTNGVMRKRMPLIDEVLDVTDLVMLDLKQIDEAIHKVLVGTPNRHILDFARHLHERGQKTRIRYVVVPGFTDDEPSAHRLGQFIVGMDNIETVELIPYHELGRHKWESLGHAYPLEGVKPPPRETIERIASIINAYDQKTMY